MPSIRNVSLSTIATCLAFFGPAIAEKQLPPAAEAQMAAVSAALAEARADGEKIWDAIRSLKQLVDADPSLAEPLRRRLDAIAEETRAGPSNPLSNLLLPLLLLGDRAGGNRVELRHDNLRFRTPAGPVPGEALLVGPGQPVASGTYMLEWTDLPKDSTTPLTIALTEGVHFAIASNNCPERPSGTGSCTVSVRFEMTGNGIRQDDMVATYYPLATHAHLYGQATGFPPADPRIVPPEETTVRLDAARPGGDARIMFRVENHGLGALPPFMPRTWSREALKSRAWTIDPSSTCTTRTTAAGESCSVVLGFYPVHNTQETVLFDVPDPRGRPDGHGEAFGYARGFAEVLPPNVLTSGDPCPAAGTSAEIVVSREPSGPGGETFNALQTTACEAWQRRLDGTLHCMDSGIREGGSRRWWRRSAADQPLQLTEIRPAEANLTCHDGAIERVWIDIPIRGLP